MVLAEKDDMIRQVKIRLDAQGVKKINENLVESLVSSYKKITETHLMYKELPIEFDYVVIEAVVEAYVRMGHEGIYSRTELGVSTAYTYKDIVDSIKQKTKGKKNPTAFLGYSR